ncbi:hypothetical protein H2202_006938 [Exophiala xenobiotica]|nr:hypothetical protein H2202_006938 [Exophiala xenobiotica]
MAEAAIRYEEPGIDTILVLLGMAWGTPGAKLLSHAFEESATQLGYLGLIAIVFEGGLATSVKSVQTNLFLSVCVAATGILLPMAFSFSLLAVAHATHLQAFAAGAALCSTSLGTTFSLLKTTDLTSSRLGTVLTSAAMLDDVVGLIMVQVIANLGSGSDNFEASTLLRPIFVSLGFAVCLPALCKFVVRPIFRHSRNSTLHLPSSLRKARGAFSSYFLLSTALLVGLVSAASYAGTSALFAAYLAGAVLSWMDEEIFSANETQTVHSDPQRSMSETVRPCQTADGDSPSPECSAESSGQICDADAQSANDGGSPQIPPAKASRLPTPPPEPENFVVESHVTEQTPEATASERQSMRMYNQYYGPVVERILKPLFFASVGFSIPITKMFRGSIVWRGIVYTILMAVGKLCCGLWLVRFTTSDSGTNRSTHSSDRKRCEGKKQERTPSFPRPKSLYPASILGCAMVARGEIGFLISAVAASNGIFTANGNGDQASSDIYLVVTWAVLLCTIVGPLGLGFLAKRVKRLQMERAQSRQGGAEDPLGIWGVT